MQRPVTAFTYSSVDHTQSKCTINLNPPRVLAPVRPFVRQASVVRVNGILTSILDRSSPNLARSLKKNLGHINQKLCTRIRNQGQIYTCGGPGFKLATYRKSYRPLLRVQRSGGRRRHMAPKSQGHDHKILRLDISTTV